MVTLNMLTEVLRRHGIGDPVSKISVDLKTQGVSRFLCPGWFSRGQPITAVLRV